MSVATEMMDRLYSTVAEGIVGGPERGQLLFQFETTDRRRGRALVRWMYRDQTGELHRGTALSIGEAERAACVYGYLRKSLRKVEA